MKLRNAHVRGSVTEREANYNAERPNGAARTNRRTTGGGQRSVGQARDASRPTRALAGVASGVAAQLAQRRHVRRTFAAAQRRHVMRTFAAAQRRRVRRTFAAAPQRHVKRTFGAAPRRHVKHSDATSSTATPRQAQRRRIANGPIEPAAQASPAVRLPHQSLQRHQRARHSLALVRPSRRSASRMSHVQLRAAR